MAFDGTGKNQILISVAAGEDLSAQAKQFLIVKLSSGAVVACTGTTDKPFGVLQNRPASGDMAEVCIFGITKVRSNAGLSVDDSIGTSSDGEAAAYTVSDTTKHIFGKVLPGGGTSNAGEYATAFIDCASARANIA